jgi:hypothetical protein
LTSLAQAVTRQVLLGRGNAAAEPTDGPEVERVQGALLGKLLGFYARSFIRHVGPQHAAAVIDELQRESLRSYVHARSAMKPVLDRELQALAGRILKEAF